tara:strand:- start:2359 stop:2724 length:366 start_codon:yes stop_codon:yes gene_type:complete
MASMFTHLKDGKRCWNEEGISIIQKRLEKEDSRAKFIDLKSLLEESLCAVGFEKKYRLGSSTCEWVLKVGDWEPVVRLSFNHHDSSIYFSINGKTRVLRDFFPLWGILRKSYLESKVKIER